MGPRLRLSSFAGNVYRLKLPESRHFHRALKCALVMSAYDLKRIGASYSASLFLPVKADDLAFDKDLLMF